MLEDYKSLDVECAAMGLLLCKGIRERYPDWRHLADGDGGDENLKDYPIEENPELTIRSVVDNVMLYQEGWGVGRIKHSLTYSGGLSRSYVRTYAPARQYGFAGFSPYTRPDVIEVAEGIPFAALTRYDVPTLYALKGEIVRRGVKAVTGLDMPVFPKRRFQHGTTSIDAMRQRLGAVGARLPPRIRAPLCVTPGPFDSAQDRPIPRRPPRAIASCSRGGAPARTRSLALPGRDRRRRADRGRRPRAHRDRAAHGPRMPVALRDVRFVDAITTVGDTPPGAIPAQVAAARSAVRDDAVPVTGMKLYNAGSFFDPRAVPEADYDGVAEALTGLSRVIVESHPALVGPRVDRLLAALDRHRGPAPLAPQLEVAMGLETAHPAALDRLNKRFTLERFAQAARALDDRGVALRVFLLISPPFVPCTRAGRVAAAFGGRRLLLRRVRRVAGADAAGQWRDRRAGRLRMVPRAGPRRHRAQLRAGPETCARPWTGVRRSLGPRAVRAVPHTARRRDAIASRP